MLLVQILTFCGLIFSIIAIVETQKHKIEAMETKNRKVIGVVTPDTAWFNKFVKNAGRIVHANAEYVQISGDHSLYGRVFDAIMVGKGNELIDVSLGLARIRIEDNPEVREQNVKEMRKAVYGCDVTPLRYGNINAVPCNPKGHWAEPDGAVEGIS